MHKTWQIPVIQLFSARLPSHIATDGKCDERRPARQLPLAPQLFEEIRLRHYGSVGTVGSKDRLRHVSIDEGNDLAVQCAYKICNDTSVRAGTPDQIPINIRHRCTPWSHVIACQC